MDREELITKIALAIKKNHDDNEGTSSYINYATQVYEDVILEERKRIIEPLIRWKHIGELSKEAYKKAIKETLKLASGSI